MTSISPVSETKDMMAEINHLLRKTVEIFLPGEPLLLCFYQSVVHTPRPADWMIECVNVNDAREQLTKHLPKYTEVHVLYKSINVGELRKRSKTNPTSRIVTQEWFCREI